MSQLEYLTGCFGGLPSRCPRKLWDFAFAGADISGKLSVFAQSRCLMNVDTDNTS
jgi:hypothetical protein